MEDALRGFTSAGSGTSSLLTGILISWLIWPVLCGLLGMRRGTPIRSAMQGFVWGPFGLIFVLLAKSHYLCPTCGHKTLKYRYESSIPCAKRAIMPPILSPAAIATCDSAQPTIETQAGMTGPETAEPPRRLFPALRPLTSQAPTVNAPPALGTRKKEAAQPVPEEEAERLFAWVNDGT